MKRRAQAWCTSCQQDVGLIKTSWNDRAGGAPKLSRHHDQNGRWCIGSGTTVSPRVVLGVAS